MAGLGMHLGSQGDLPALSIGPIGECLKMHQKGIYIVPTLELGPHFKQVPTPYPSDGHLALEGGYWVTQSSSLGCENLFGKIPNQWLTSPKTSLTCDATFPCGM